MAGADRHPLGERRDALRRRQRSGDAGRDGSVACDHPRSEGVGVERARWPSVWPRPSPRRRQGRTDRPARRRPRESRCSRRRRARRRSRWSGSRGCCRSPPRRRPSPAMPARLPTAGSALLGAPIRYIPDVSAGQDAENEKRLAAEAAAELVSDGMLVGLGTGSTVAHLLPALAARKLDIRCVATSVATEERGASSAWRSSRSRARAARHRDRRRRPDRPRRLAGQGRRRRSHPREDRRRGRRAVRRDRRLVASRSTRSPPRSRWSCTASGSPRRCASSATPDSRRTRRLARRRPDRRLPRRGPRRPDPARGAAVGHPGRGRPRPLRARPGRRRDRRPRRRGRATAHPL